MSSKKLSTDQNEIERTVERASYLASETNMLKRVIEYIPYDEKPPQKPSVQEILNQIKKLQRDYVMPLIQKVMKNSIYIRHQNINNWYSQMEEESEEPEEDVQQILQDITRYRNQLLDQLGEWDTEYWEKSINQGERERRLIDVIEEIIEFERSLLSNISDQVRVFSQQRSNQRDIESRKKSQDLSD